MTIAWPIALPALLFVATPARALEPWGLPDLREQDKQEHAAAGVAVGAAGAGIAGMIMPRSTWWTRALIGTAAAAVVGAAKEAADSQSRRHTSDPKDALATVAGGAVGALTISLVWRF